MHSSVHCKQIWMKLALTISSARQILLSLRQVAASFLLVAMASMLSPAPSVAQTLSPRAYWPSPVGTNVLVLGYQRTEGDIVIDQALPIIGVESTIDYLQASFQHTFDWWGRTGTVQISQAMSDGTTSGSFEGELRSRRIVGPLDTTGRLAINLRGAPAMRPEEFRELLRDPEPILGVSLIVSAPTGEYEADRLINNGTNRWAIKPSVGGIYPLWPSVLLEAELGVWFYQDNDEFLGVTREQEPMLAAEMHLVKRFRPGFWAALDANYYTGGRTQVNGGSKSGPIRNARFGATLVYPIAKGHALRWAVSTGTLTEIGGDYDLMTLAWIHAF